MNTPEQSALGINNKHYPVSATVIVSECVCVRACVSCTFKFIAVCFHKILHVIVFDRTVLYMCIEYHI